MAKQTKIVSDLSGQEIQPGHGAKVVIKFNDARKGAFEIDVTDDEAAKFGGRKVGRRGRRPAALAG